MTAGRPGMGLFRMVQPLTLASASPRRRELLQAMGLSFDVTPSGIEEIARSGETPGTQVRRWAYEKALAISRCEPDRWVLAADTIVVLGDAVLGKPEGPEEASRMLRMLGGRKHEVESAVCLIHNDRHFVRIDSVRTEVSFKELTEKEIRAYIATGEPFDKAGGYGIQGAGAFLVRSIHGSYTNVVGLPLCETLEWLTEAGVIAPSEL